MSTRYPGDRAHATYQCRPNTVTATEGVCFGVAAKAIDPAVEELFLAAVQPPQIELALAVAREVEHQAGEIDQQWKLRLDRVRYEAQLAERRYKAVDPDNRVVARTLEREWNEKLQEIAQTELEHRDLRQRQKVELSADDRHRILALVKDLPSVWRAKTTTSAERKNLLRMLVREVTLTPIEVPKKMTRVQVWWQTGAVSDFNVQRKDKYTAQATPEETVEALRKLFAEGKADEEIVATLNRKGLGRTTGRPWDVPAIRRIRYATGLYRPSTTARRVPDQRPDGLCSIHGVAKRLGVTPSNVRCWMKNGLLVPVEGGGTPHPWWFRLDGATIQRLETAKAKRFGHTAWHQGVLKPEEGHYG